ncbi:hypothetical protein [Streptomyces liangshanensis]|uniref:hypothetical protein n=1 Tax=Streptomyces liangshanensis TaxID=2717324 RepID=UPI0036DAE8BF
MSTHTQADVSRWYAEAVPRLARWADRTLTGNRRRAAVMWPPPFLPFFIEGMRASSTEEAAARGREGRTMEIVVVMVLMGVGPVVRKLVKSVTDRHRAEAEAVVIVAQGWADGVRTTAQAEVIRARSGETRRAGEAAAEALVTPRAKGKGARSSR